MAQGGRFGKFVTQKLQKVLKVLRKMSGFHVVWSVRADFTRAGEKNQLQV